MESIGNSGRAAYGNVNTWRTFNMVADRGDMLEADQGDLKKIWDALYGGEAELVC